MCTLHFRVAMYLTMLELWLVVRDFRLHGAGKVISRAELETRRRFFFFFPVSTSPECECISGQFSNAADDRDCRLNAILMYILPHLIKAFFQAVWCTCVCMCVPVQGGGGVRCIDTKTRRSLFSPTFSSSRHLSLFLFLNHHNLC